MSNDLPQYKMPLTNVQRDHILLILMERSAKWDEAHQDVQEFKSLRSKAHGVALVGGILWMGLLAWVSLKTGIHDVAALFSKKVSP